MSAQIHRTGSDQQQEHVYQCCRSPWRECQVWAYSRSGEWLPPSLGSAHSAAWRSMWSCTSAIKTQLMWKCHSLCDAHIVHNGVAPGWNWWVWERFSTAAGCQESPPQCLQLEKERPPGLHCCPAVSQQSYQPAGVFIKRVLFLLRGSYRFAGFLVLRGFLVIFLVSFKGCRVNNMETLCPLPIERTQLLFAVKKHKHTVKQQKGFLTWEGSAPGGVWMFQCVNTQVSCWTTDLCVVSLPNFSRIR